MSEGWKNGRFELFKCPLCGDERYVEVRVQRPGGQWYVTPFLQCVGCTVMFRDPVRFSGMCIRPDVDSSGMRMVGRYGVGPQPPEGEDKAGIGPHAPIASASRLLVGRMDSKVEDKSLEATRIALASWRELRVTWLQILSSFGSATDEARVRTAQNALQRCDAEIARLEALLAERQ